MVIERTDRAGDPRLEAASLADVEAVRLLLRGGSVIDWQRVEFRDLNDVDRFLRVNEFDPGSERDLGRLEQLRGEAVTYLRRSLGFRMPDDVAGGMPVRELFLLASRKSRRSVYACIVLKVMHIIHHLAGRELLYRSPISDDEVFRLVERKVVRAVEELRAAGHPVVEFEWSRKSRDSLITKLLAKRSTLAANVYDKLRFRLVLRDHADLLPALVAMTHRLIPFNYIVPGESQNDLLPFRRLVEATPELARYAAQLQDPPEAEEREAEERRGPRANEFSGPGYRVVNFVVDMPVRLDDFLCRVGDPGNQEFGSIVFVLTEFQVVDLRTAQENDAGENSHDKYKERQHERVKMRLLRGLPALDRAPTAPDGSATNPGVPSDRGSDEG